MTARLRARFFCIIAGTVLLFSACASSNRAALQGMSEESGRILASGEVERALDPFTEAYRKNPGDKSLILHYIAAVEGIWQKGAESFAKHDYVMAERIYRALWDHYPNFESFASRLTFTKSTLEEKLKQSRTNLADGLGQSALKSGDYAKALEVYQAALKDYPGDKTLLGRYAFAANQIMAAAIKASAGGNHATAGKAYYLLLRNYASFEGIRPGVTFARKNLTDGIAACRANLKNVGLAEYRKGNFAKAIAVWEGLLAFDPGNAEIKKAVETAKTQQKELLRKK